MDNTNRDIKTEFQGRWHSVLIAAGIDDKYLTGRHSPCVFCDGRDRARWIHDKEVLWCNSCSPKSGLDALMQYMSFSFKEACDYLRGSKNEYKKMTEKKKVDPIKRLKLIHRGLKKTVAGDVVSQYLQFRGINIIGDNVFTHTNIPYYGSWVNNEPVQGVFSAMVCRITNWKGELESYHVTYLTPEGRKIEFAPAKVIITPKTTISGCAVQLGALGEHLCLAEGVETALAVQENEGVTCWSTISAVGMEKIAIPRGVRQVSIFADNDESGTGQAAAYALMKRLQSKGLNCSVIMEWDKGQDYLSHLQRGVVTEKQLIWSDIRADAPDLANAITEMKGLFGDIQLLDLKMSNGKKYRM